MGDCVFCGRRLGANECRQHDACQAEWERRLDGHLCTKCGVAAVEPTHSWCSACVHHSVPYSDYPGGA